jgi:transcriptional regulator with XRE-family HTH domain
MMNNFGEFLREKRLALGLGLREFCLRYKLDASNYSKIERGTSSPPSREKVEQYAEYLKVQKDSDDWLTLFDLAAISKGKLPDYILDNKKFVATLPVFLRKASTGSLYTKEELIQLAEDIRKSK